MSFITAASRFGFSPACSMVAIESDIWRKVTRCAVKWPISAAARSGGSFPASRISSITSWSDER